MSVDRVERTGLVPALSWYEGSSLLLRIVIVARANDFTRLSVLTRTRNRRRRPRANEISRLRLAMISSSLPAGMVKTIARSSHRAMAPLTLGATMTYFDLKESSVFVEKLSRIDTLDCLVSVRVRTTSCAVGWPHDSASAAHVPTAIFMSMFSASFRRQCGEGHTEGSVSLVALAPATCARSRADKICLICRIVSRSSKSLGLSIFLSFFTYLSFCVFAV